MLADEIKAGESTNIEFKVEVPKKSERYIRVLLHLLTQLVARLLLVWMMKHMR